jgi:hypothetical protein
LDAAPGLVPLEPLNLTEDREANKELRCLCGLLLGSRTIELPQFCYGGRERRIQTLHHKWLNRRDLRSLPRTAPRPPPDRPQAAPRPPSECRRMNAECRMAENSALKPPQGPFSYFIIHPSAFRQAALRLHQCDIKATSKRHQSVLIVSKPFGAHCGHKPSCRGAGLWKAR